MWPFKKRVPTAAVDEERAWALRDIAELKSKVERLDPVGVRAFEMVLALHWKAFISSKGGAEQFASSPRTDQMDYFKKWVAFGQQFQNGPAEEFLATNLLTHFLSAIISRDAQIEAELAKFLDAHARRGWDLV